MCGIVALFYTKHENLDLSAIKKMAHLISHRGPDDEGYVFFHKKKETYISFPAFGEGTPDIVKLSPYPYTSVKPIEFDPSTQSAIALGHRRLSILDLTAAGHQPMCSPDNQYWIVYNGEIYNHQELRSECEALGYKFFSNTDSEVVLAAYSIWGTGCIHRLSGMWAFIIIDINENKAFISRDRFGMKPLYFWFSPDGILAFASEIKAFTCLPGWDAELNADRVLDYIIQGFTDHTNETLFRDVFQLRGGECLEFSIKNIPHNLPVHRWDIVHKPVITDSIDDIFINTRKSVIRSIKKHLISDVPVVACLSGGIDSTVIAAISSHNDNNSTIKQVNEAFTVITPGYINNEEAAATKTAELLHLKSHTVLFSVKETIDDLDKIIWHQDEPFNSMSILMQWSLFKEISQRGFYVVLDGQGPDELLGGYHPHLPLLLMQLLSEKQFGAFIREIIFGARYLALVTTVIKNLPQELRGYLSLDSPSKRKNQIQSFIHPDYYNQYKTKAFTMKTRYNYGDVNGLWHDLAYTKSLPMLLRYEDRNSMAHSVESRLPYLDPDVVDHLIHTPAICRVFHGYLKYSLRKAFETELPVHVRKNRKKIGFSGPENEWLSGPGHAWMMEELEKTVIFCQGLLHPSIKEMGKSVFGSPNEYQNFLWRLIIVGRWMNVFHVNLPKK